MSPETVIKVRELITNFLHTFRKEMEKCVDHDDLGYINLVVAATAFKKLILKDFEECLKQDMIDNTEINNILNAIEIAAEQAIQAVPHVNKYSVN